MAQHKMSKFKLLICVLIGFALSVTHIVAAQKPLVIVTDAGWNSTGAKLGIGYQFGSLEIVNAASGEIILSDSSFESVTSLAWSPTNPDFMAIGGRKPNQSGVVEILDTASNKVLFTFDGGPSVRDVIWSPDGNKVAASSSLEAKSPTERNEVRIWDAKTGELLSHNAYAFEAITAIAWSPDGNQIAGSTADNLVLVWSAVDGKLIHTLKGHSSVVTSVAWSPDGSRLASTGGIEDNTVRVWDVANEKNIATFPSHSGIVRWSPDGKELALGEVLSVRILDAATGQEHTVITINEVIRTIAYSPSGGRLIFGGAKNPYPPSTITQSTVPIKDYATESIHLIVPNPSLGKLQSMSQTCGLQASIQQSLTSQITANQLQTFTTQVSALTDAQIPAGCKADLLAVANALMAKPQ